MSSSFLQAWQMIVHYLPKLAAGVIVLLVGWLLAALIARGIQAAVARSGLGRHMAKWLGENEAQSVAIERRFGRVSYYILLLLVLVGTFQALGLLLVSQPLNQFVTTIFSYMPRILGAATLLLAAYLLANLTRFLVRKSLNIASFGKRVEARADLSQDGNPTLVNTIAETAHWLVYLLFIPGIVGALNIPGLLGPFSSMSKVVVSYLPHLLGAALILVVGWFLARIIQRILSNLLKTVGADALGQRVGLNKVMSEQLSTVIGLVVYVLILIPVLIAVLNALQLPYVTEPASHMLNITLTALPHIFAAFLVILFSWFVGRALARLAEKLLSAIGFNRLFVHLGLPSQSDSPSERPTAIVGWLVLVAVLTFATLEALQLLGFTFLAGLVSRFLVFGAHILFGLVIIGIGLAVANWMARMVRQSQNSQSGLLALVARVAIIGFGFAIGLQQMGVANDIINLAFGLILGAVAVAAAIAFGIGGRDVAGQVVHDLAKRARGEAGNRHSDGQAETSANEEG
ncbi:MAG: mechanosensitive ion channel [Alicyclobacillaceae bacterium]|nr:mechanosensitive ion channel [Alicyclobacillaceae bacterium]